jgi:hypothetical protein
MGADPIGSPLVTTQLDSQRTSARRCAGVMPGKPASVSAGFGLGRYQVPPATAVPGLAQVFTMLFSTRPWGVTGAKPSKSALGGERAASAILRRRVEVIKKARRVALL